MVKNLIGCWGSPAANQILRHSNPIFSNVNRSINDDISFTQPIIYVTLLLNVEVLSICKILCIVLPFLYHALYLILGINMKSGYHRDVHLQNTDPDKDIRKCS